MTEVAGPLGPFDRFSSLPIWGRKNASAADGSGFRVRCDMAQALNIPMRRSDGSLGSLTRSRRGFPSSRSPLPVSPAHERPSIADMGQGPGPRKRAERGPDAPETVRFPSPAIAARLINSGGFDKAGREVVQQL